MPLLLAIAVVLLGIAILSPVTGVAALIPSGGERIVNEVTSGSQLDPAAAELGNGDFIVTWSDLQPDDPASHVRGRVLAPDATPRGPQFQIDGNNTSLNQEPDIVRLSDGGFVVVWVRRSLSISGTPILIGRKLDSTGVPAGVEFQLNPPQQLGPEDYLGAPSVAPAADGGFVVAWARGEEMIGGFGGKATVSEIYVRRFDVDAQPVGDPVMISEPTTNVYARDAGEILPRVRARQNGFVVTWAAGDVHYSYYAVFVTRLRYLATDGTPTGVVSEAGSGGATGPDVALTSSGGTRVVWTPYEPGYVSTTEPINVIGRGFDAAGAATSPAYRLTGGVTGAGRVSVQSLPGDRVAVAWATGVSGWISTPNDAFDGDGDGVGVFGGAFDLDGRPFGPALQLNEGIAGDQTNATLAVGGDAILAVWQSIKAPDGGDVVVRPFTVAPLECGDADEDGRTSASDALWSLQAAVGIRDCLPCACDANGSGDHSATDALAVLGASVGLAVDLACPVCPTTPRAAFRLATDGNCSSAYAKIPRTALPDTAWSLSCETHPQLQALPCTAKVEERDEGIIFEARGCEISQRDVFTCVASDTAARAMAEAAEIGCGCGCQAECPAPRVCTGDGAAATCSTAAPLPAAPAVIVSVPASRTPGPSSTGTATTVTNVDPTYTTSTFCGTCCGLYDTGGLELTSDHIVTEIVVRVKGDAGPDCVWCYPGYAYQIGNETVEFCVTDPFGIDGPGTLSECVTNQGDVLPGPGEVVRALGIDFKPIDPVPTAEVRFK